MKAYYHLPGLFEFYGLYRLFLPLFYTRREYFYDWCGIGSVYGAPGDCLWGGGRVGFGEDRPEDVAALYPNARRECGLQLLPGPDGDEGFFMARLRRQG